MWKIQSLENPPLTYSVYISWYRKIKHLLRGNEVIYNYPFPWRRRKSLTRWKNPLCGRFPRKSILPSLAIRGLGWGPWGETFPYAGRSFPVSREERRDWSFGREIFGFVQKKRLNHSAIKSTKNIILSKQKTSIFWSGEAIIYKANLRFLHIFQL